MRKKAKQILRKSLCGILCAAMLFSGISVPEFSAKAAEIEITEETAGTEETENKEESTSREESEKAQESALAEEKETEEKKENASSEEMKESEDKAEESTSREDEKTEETKQSSAVEDEKTEETETREVEGSTKEETESSESTGTQVETVEESTGVGSDLQEEEEQQTEIIVNANNEVNFYYYIGTISNEEIGLCLYDNSSISIPESSDITWQVKTDWKPTVYKLTPVSGSTGWFEIAIFINGETASGGFEIYKSADNGVTCENIDTISQWSGKTIFDKLFENGITSLAVKDGNSYSSIAEAEGQEPSSETKNYENKQVNLNFYVGDLDANAAEEVGFYKWGQNDNTIIIDTGKNPLLTWGGWDDKTKNPVYKMEEVAEHSGWFHITFTANETIVTDSSDSSNNSSLGSFAIFRSKEKDTELINCSGFKDKYPEIYKGLLDGNIQAIKYTDDKPIGYASIEEAEEATKEPDNPDEPDQPREWTFEELQALITEADTYKEADYTKASWKVFSDALDEARKVTENATKEQIMAAYEALGIAKNVLVAGSISVAKLNLPNDFITGADLSSYLSLKNSGVVFKDEEGNELNDAAFFNYLKDGGTNWVRIRVWNDPFDADKNGYGGGNSNIEVAKKIGKWATDAGMQVLIDFHYSDFWADPGKQMEPKVWAGFTVEQKVTAIEEFTKNSLNELKSAGVNVGMVQIGNETTNAICGVTLSNWADSSKIFNAGSKAVREFDENCLIAIHFTNPERVGNYANFAKNLNNNNVDYDVFASSYYPFWHGTLENLTTQLADIAKTYDKKVMVAETSWATTLDDQDGHGNTVRKGTNDKDPAYDFSIQGQAEELRAVIKAVNDVNDTASGKGIGVFYWEPAWISKNYVYRADGGINQELLDANKELWETHGSGWASSYANEYDPKDVGKWYGGSAIDNQAWFDFFGNALPTAKVYSYIRTGETAAEMAITGVKDPSISIEMGGRVIYPDKVTVSFNDSSKVDYAVVWNAVDKEKVDTENVGEYIVKGTVTCEYKLNNGSMKKETRDVIFTITVKQPVGENLLSNPSFEDGTTSSWTVTKKEGFSYSPKTSSATNDNRHDGKWSLHFWSEDVIGFTVSQEIRNLEEGTYIFGGYILGDDSASGSKEQFAYVEVYDRNGNQKGEKRIAKCSLEGFDAGWMNPEITGIEVSEGDYLVVGMDVETASGGAWGDVDDFYLYGIYDVTVDSTIEAGTGSINASRSKSVAGKEIEITAKPDDGYTLDKLTISGNGIKAETDTNNMLIQSSNGTVTQSEGSITIVYPANTTMEQNEPFKMPNGSVTISATFTSTGVVDKSVLEQLIADCEKETDSSKYTEASWTAFSEALEAANAIFNNENATQAQVNNAKNALNDAHEGLKIKVNFAELNALIEQYKDKTQDNFTDKSWQAFQDALNAAKEIAKNENENVTQAEVDEAKDALQSAFEGLKENTSDETDFTKLNELLAECEALNEDDYTKASWEVFAKAHSEAQAVAGNKDATQAEVNNAKNALQDAKDALKTNREESLEALENLIAEYKDMQQDNYTQESWDAFQQALKDAQDIIKNENATIEELNAAKEKLQSAYDALKESTSDVVDKTDLNNLIAKYKDTPKGDYTEASWKAFEDALTAANTISQKADATQAEVNNTKNALQNAYDHLETKADVTASKEALNALIAQYQGTPEDAYTKESWDVFAKALKEAQDISNKADAAKAELDEAKTNLQKAYDDLVKITPDTVDKTELNKLITECQSLIEEEYTDVSWEALQAALKEAQNINQSETATQPEVDEAKNALQSARNALRKVPQGLWAEDIEDMIYTGSALKPTVKVYDGRTLLTSKDYSVSYKNNTKVTTDSELANVVIKGKGNYSGTVTKDFRILPKHLEDKDILVSDLYALVAENNTAAVKINPVVTRNGKKLKLNKEYTIEKEDKQEGAYAKPGKYQVTIKAVENSGYTGSKEITLTLADKSEYTLMSSVKIKKIPNQLYNEGKAIEPEVIVTLKNKPLTLNKDYKVKYSENNTQAGETVTVTVYAIEGDKNCKFIGEKTTTFKITGTPLKAGDITLKDEKTSAPITNAGLVYTGKEIRPNVDSTISAENYTVTYQNNIKAGKATVLITGKNGYTGTVKKTFKITPYDLKGNTDKAFVYAENITAPYAKGGSKLTDALLQAKFNGMDMVQGVDYTLSYTNNKKVGGAFVKIKGKGNFKGTTETIPFTIQKQSLLELKDISAADLIEKNAKKYKTNNPVVKDLDGKLLKKGTDYEIKTTYWVDPAKEISAEQIPAGEYPQEMPEIPAELLKAGTKIGLTISGLGNYEGETVVAFRIIADNKNLSKAVIKVDDQYYTGKEIEPHGTDEKKDDRAVKVSIKIKENGTTTTYDLREGVDYEILGYTKNINKGTAKITIHGIGTYGGTKTGSFKIKQQQMKWYDNVNQVLFQFKELLN